MVILMKEFSGKLRDIDNYDIFFNTIVSINKRFREVFGDDIVDKYDLFIDNATSGSGHTPVCVPILKKYILIKLHVSDFSDKDIIIYQYSHELLHYISYAINGLLYKDHLDEEEQLASACSLIMLKEYNSKRFDYFCSYVSNLEDKNYKQGTKLAEKLNFDIYKLKDILYKLYKK